MFKKFVLGFIIISLFSTSVPYAALGKQVDIKPSKDTYVHSGFPDTNYGSTNELFSWIQSGGYTMYPLFGFSLVQIPKKSRISKATLSVYGSANSSAQNVSANQVTSDWQENQVTYNNFANAYSQTALSTTQVGTTANYYSWNVTSLVKQWYSKQTSNNGLTLIDATDDSNWITLHSESFAQNPYIRIFYSIELVKSFLRMLAKKNVFLGQILQMYGSLKDADGITIVDKTIYILIQNASGKGEEAKVKAKSKWKIIGKTKTNKKGKFSFKYKPSETAIYRAYFPGDKKYKKSYSKSFKVTVKKK